uniref:Uncharacterized protein n=1 Tax=Arion vulgaris TaxID=1028688 RepID=A0A0B6YZW4_9EUPU
MIKMVEKKYANKQQQTDSAAMLAMHCVVRSLNFLSIQISFSAFWLRLKSSADLIAHGSLHRTPNGIIKHT